MSRSVVACGVIRVVLCVVAAAGGPFPKDCLADAEGVFVRPLGAAVRKQSLKKVLVVLREDATRSSGQGPPAEIAALAEQVAERCRDLGVEPVSIDDAADVPQTTLNAAPSAAAFADLLKQNDADAVMTLTWRTGKSSQPVRMALVDGKKLLWTARSTVRSAAQQAATNTRAANRQTAAAATVGSYGPQIAGALPSGSLPGLGASLLGAGGGQFGGGSGTAWGTPGPAANALTTAPSAADGSTQTGTLPELNAKILQFATDAVGRQVGDGNCFTLAVEALAYAGAERARGNDWGDDVAIKDLQPGDILQFYSVVLSSPAFGQWQLGTPGHTAIVGEVHGTVVTVYHQNISDVPRVRKDALDLGSLVSGQILGYRAVGRR